MIKNILKIMSVLLLFVFSFFYTYKVVTLVKSKDPLMIKLDIFEETYNIKAINALINEEEIIPGINGCIVNKNKSYLKMKQINRFNPNMIEYFEIKPELSLAKVYDKYIIRGNKIKNEVALIFKITKLDYLKEVLKVLSSKKVLASFFIDGSIIEHNSKIIYEIVKNGHEIYNLGYDGRYEEDLLLWTNNMIEAIGNNSSNYCLVPNERENDLRLCAKYKMHTIKTDLLINLSNNFSINKNKIEKGSIITFDLNRHTKTELLGVINFLNSKDYQYNLISNHLSEQGCF